MLVRPSVQLVQLYLKDKLVRVQHALRCCWCNTNQILHRHLPKLGVRIHQLHLQLFLVHQIHAVQNFCESEVANRHQALFPQSEYLLSELNDVERNQNLR